MLVPMLMYVPLLSIFPLPSIGDKLAARYWSDHGRIHGQSDIMSPAACHMAQKCKMRNQFDAGIVGRLADIFNIVYIYKSLAV